VKPAGLALSFEHLNDVESIQPLDRVHKIESSPSPLLGSVWHPPFLKVPVRDCNLTVPSSIKDNPYLWAYNAKLVVRPREDASVCASNARYANDDCKAKVISGLPRYLTGFGKTAFAPVRITTPSTPRISRNRLAVWVQRRQEPVSTSAENALWCRDFAAGKVILSIDIKGLAGCRGLWRLV
jgi:hypothetical protein